jgi:hypothetical protein
MFLVCGVAFADENKMSAVDAYAVVERKSGYPDVLYIEPYFYFIYYDEYDYNILNIFVIDESFFYTTIPGEILY